MTREEAIRLLDPETTAEAIAEIEYYAGFNAKTASIQAITEACELAVEDMRRQIETNEEETLTAGLLRRLIGNRNIPELSRLIEGVDDSHRLDLLDLAGAEIVAYKLWTIEDIKDSLIGLGYPVTEENISAVIKSGDLGELCDCTDTDWEIIHDAIRENAKK